ncbi:plastocyanin [Planktothrix sp. FACHB-1365]|uniref:plastocyanin n=1 Tax=Planktothrix sp. FACHB-1365 TaxID=2692855 RepID=UPI00168420DE|nr:plastocyanin [Planktothrix sp. FACHB-1365]MBD2485147.1 plastocyanin [Planktothrix sp. FACHB-1365]
MNRIVSLSKRVALVLSVALLMISTFVFGADQASANSYEVTMGAGGLAFSPKKVTVKPGDTVTFKVGMLPPHNVVFDADKSADKDIANSLSHKKLESASGKTFDITIPANAPAGVYPFFCSPHRGAGMIGELVVTQ